MKKPVLCLVGPTASGKTAVGIRLAEILLGEILSADARQVYRFLDIGTAKPTAEERKRIPHHLIDVADPDEPFHAARFVKLAEEALADLQARGVTPIVAGGTGLYVRALLRGLDVPVGRDPELRRRLFRRIEEEGTGALHEELSRVDPESAARIHPNDPTRIVRAIEVHHITGEKQSAQHRPNRPPHHPHRMAGLLPPRDRLYRRIDERFDEMMEAGLLEEVRALLGRGFPPDLPSFQSPGYREMIAHLRGELSLKDAVERAKGESRRYAKRQITWFRKEDVFWVDPAGEGGAEGATKRILHWWQNPPGL
jgi:tRNA dimethylallyltransferase